MMRIIWAGWAAIVVGALMAVLGMFLSQGDRVEALLLIIPGLALMVGGALLTSRPIPKAGLTGQ